MIEILQLRVFKKYYPPESIWKKLYQIELNDEIFVYWSSLWTVI